MTQQPSTPPTTPPTGPGTPWPDPAPISQPGNPRYQPTRAERADARRRLARHQGNPDRQAHLTLGAVQARIGLLTGHLRDHADCDRACPLLADEVRALTALSQAFDEAMAARVGFTVRRAA